jgi:hypothetical protein
MSQSMPAFGPATLFNQPVESTVQLWIRIWQAQLVARSRRGLGSDPKASPHSGIDPAEPQS